jgi:hypothetical protein
VANIETVAGSDDGTVCDLLTGTSGRSEAAPDRVQSGRSGHASATVLPA